MTKSTQRDLALLKLIAEYRILLTRQIAFLDGTGLRAAQKRIMSLFDYGCLSISRHNSATIEGRPENVYSLNKKAAEFLVKTGGLDSEISIKRLVGEDIINIRHELLVNWFRMHLRYIGQQIADLDTQFFSATSPFLPLNAEGKPFIADRVTTDRGHDGFIPDGVFSIASTEQKKRLLFFLEVDMDTESLQSSRPQAPSISGKTRAYHAYFVSQGYTRYEITPEEKLNGFRALFLTSSPQRKEQIGRFLATNPSFDFIWLADADQMFRQGLSARIWSKGGTMSRPFQSILGPSLACALPLPEVAR